jgi:hypothetical protein
MNEKSETSKLLKVIAEKEQKLAEAQSIISEKQQIVEAHFIGWLYEVPIGEEYYQQTYGGNK